MGLDEEQLRQALSKSRGGQSAPDRRLQLAKKAIKKSILGYRLKADEGKPGSMTRPKTHDASAMPE